MMQAFEIGKMADFDESVNRGPSLTNTVLRKLLNDPEGNFSSNLPYSDDRPVSPMCLLQNCGRGNGKEGGEGAGVH